MFGMSFAEIIVIAVVAVIFLGPDKLPQAMVKIAKFFKYFKQTVNSAKSTFEAEVRIAELKEDAKKFKDSITDTTSSVRKKLTFEELDELKKTASDLKDDIKDSLSLNASTSSKNALDSLNNANFDDENQKKQKNQDKNTLNSPNDASTSTLANSEQKASNV